MKKVTLIAALCISMLAFSSTPEKTIGIKIKFGKPSLGCLKFGICDFSIVFNLDDILESLLTSKEERTGYGYAIGGKSSGIRLTLLKQALSEESRKTFFSNGEFIVEEDYPLPNEVCDVLGLTPGYVIRKGVYPYSENLKEIILNL